MTDIDRVDQLSSRSPRELALEQRLVEAEKERDALKAICQAWRNRLEAAEQQSAQLRSAVIEECAKVADDFKRDGSGYAQAYECETADEIAARIRALHTATGETDEQR